VEEADKAARYITASIAPLYGISASKITISGLNKDLPGIQGLLKRKQRLRKLLQVTRDRTYKRTVNCVDKPSDELPVERHSNNGKQK
jgi:hypothetical protein